MINKISSTKTEYGFLFAILFFSALAIGSLIHINKTKDLFVSALLILICAFFIYKFLHFSSLSYDANNAYLSKFGRADTIPFLKILAVRRDLSSIFSWGAEKQFGYALVYETVDGVKKETLFFVAPGKKAEMEDFKKLVALGNPGALIKD